MTRFEGTTKRPCKWKKGVKAVMDAMELLSLVAILCSTPSDLWMMERHGDYHRGRVVDSRYIMFDLI